MGLDKLRQGQIVQRMYSARSCSHRQIDALAGLTRRPAAIRQPTAPAAVGTRSTLPSTILYSHDHSSIYQSPSCLPSAISSCLREYTDCLDTQVHVCFDQPKKNAQPEQAQKHFLFVHRQHVKLPVNAVTYLITTFTLQVPVLSSRAVRC